MSYPPPYNQQLGGSIGFEGLGQGSGAPYLPGSGYPPSSHGYPPGSAAPYPATTGVPPYGNPAPPNPGYATGGAGMPSYGAPGFGPQSASFQGAALAVSAFRPPPSQSYGPPNQMYNQPSGYAPPPSQGYQQPPPQQSYHAPSGPQPQYQPAHPPHTSQPQGQVQAPQLHRHATLPSKHMLGEGTVKDHSPFNPQHDAEVLRKAMKGFGCDDKAVIHILVTRSNKQRQQISLAFKTAYGRDLMKDLQSELGGHLEEVILGLMYPPAQYDAIWLRKAMKGFGTDEDILIEILCTRTNSELRAINEAYTRLYQRNLEKDIQSETSGHFKRMLIAQVQGGRDENPVVDIGKAQKDAQDLYKAGEGRWGTDESRFNVILSDRSYPQLRATFAEYQKVCKHSIEVAIDREMSGDLKQAMLTVVKCVKNTPSYFAEQLYKSMKGLGTDDDRLQRICISRSEIDMVQIKQAFANMYGQTLGRFISDDTSGNYKRALIELIGGVK